MHRLGLGKRCLVIATLSLVAASILDFAVLKQYQNASISIQIARLIGKTMAFIVMTSIFTIWIKDAKLFLVASFLVASFATVFSAIADK
jgi:hypothetical protein